MSLFGGEIHPVARILINNIVSKRFGLTKAEASGMTIEEKARLLKSTFSEAYIKHLLEEEAEEEVNRFLAPLKSLLHLCFPALAECDAECEERLARTDAAIEFYFNLIFFSGAAGVFSLFGFHVIAHVLAKPCRTSAKWLWNKLFPSSQHDVARLTNNADQQSSGSAQESDATQEERSVLPDSCLHFSTFSEEPGVEEAVEHLEEN